jgi:FkbM family methyltransferase
MIKMNNFKEKLLEIETEVLNSAPAKTLRDIKTKAGNRPLVLYGAGRLGQAIADTYIVLGITIDVIGDKNLTGDYREIPIVTPDVLRRDFPDAVVVVCSYTYNNEICDELNRCGFSSEQVVPYPLNSEFFESLNGFSKHYNGYEWAYSFFEDERSKQLVLDRIRLYLCDASLAPNTDCSVYYEKGFIELEDNEIFVDGGAFTGDTAKDFIAVVDKKYSHVYLFEPDELNYEKAVRNLHDLPNITFLQKGLWREESELVFYRNEESPFGSSFLYDIKGATEIKVPVMSIDELFKDKPELPTFIKMDIEGAEKEALIGASNVIKAGKPKLAICAYHKIEDTYELPQTILNIRDDYKFCLRQYTFGKYDTIMYAV